MPRLVNKANGVAVNVDEDTAARLGRGWVESSEATPAKVPESEQSAEPDPEAAAEPGTDSESADSAEPETDDDAGDDKKPARRGRRTTN